MKIRDKLDMHHPGKPLSEVLAWLTSMSNQGFSPDCLVKVGKTTGQKYVLIIEDEIDTHSAPIITTPAARVRPAMWGDE